MAGLLPAVECGPLDPLCDALAGVPAGAADLVLSSLGGSFVSAADAVSKTALAALDATTRPDLTADWFRSNLGVIAAVTLPVLVGLFVLQVIGSVLRREPGGLVRAVVGVGKATVGAVLAVAATQSALVATDEVCHAIAASAGTTVPDAAAHAVGITYLTGPQAGPVLQLLLGLAVIVGCLLLWVVLLFRKAAVVLVAVFAPIAFAGSVFDHTRVWTRRWIEAVAALVVCKVVIVVVFVVGAAAFARPAGAAASDPASGLSDVLVGLLLLSMAICAPWLTWRFVHWSGVEAGTALHGVMTASPVPAGARRAVGMATQLGTSAAMTAVAGPAGAAVGGRAARGGVSAAASGAARRDPVPAGAAGRSGGVNGHG